MAINKKENNANKTHPEKPGAIGSRNSLLREDRNEYEEGKLLIDEQVDRILHHIENKLPQEVLSDLNVTSNVKSLLHNYYNQGLQNMISRYLATTEDELLKKYNSLINTEETKNMLEYTPLFISDILNKLGEPETFHTGKVETSLTNIYHNLQSHVNKSLHNFAEQTNASLVQKEGAGAFVSRNSAYKMIKCSFKNNRKKPSTVLDIKLAFNILNIDLLLPIHHYQETLDSFLKETLANNLYKTIENRVDKLSQSIEEDKGEVLSPSRHVFEHIRQLDDYIGNDEDIDNPESVRYSNLAKKLIDYLKDVPNEKDMDHNSPGANIRNIIESSRLQYMGFDYVINTITSLLDEANLGCQLINNLKNARECIIKEYTNLKPEEQPDENFGIRLVYYNNEQLQELRETWNKQASDLEQNIESTLRVILKLYQQHQESNQTTSYFDVAQKIAGIDSISSEDNIYKEILWHELQVYSNNLLEEHNLAFFDRMKSYIKFMDTKLEECYKDQFPKERMIIEKRINFLEEQFLRFSSLTNPHHLQMGLLVEVDITTIKDQKYSLLALSKVLNKFLEVISKQFVDANIANFKAAQENKMYAYNEENNAS